MDEFDLNKTIYNFEFCRSGFPGLQDYFFYDNGEIMMEQKEKILENNEEKTIQETQNCAKMEKRAKAYELKFKEKIEETENNRVEKTAKEFQISREMETAARAAGENQATVLKELTEIDEKFSELDQNSINSKFESELPTGSKQTYERMSETQTFEYVEILSKEINTWNTLIDGRMKRKNQELVMLEKQLLDAETTLQNLFEERFQLLNEKENLTEDNKHFVKMFTELKEMLEKRLFRG